MNPPELTTSRLPRRPRPEEGESLTSWLLRLAHANAERLTYLSHHLSGDQNLWVRDLDRHLRPEVVASFCRAGSLDEAEVRAMLLSRYEGRLFSALGKHDSSRWILPLAKRGYHSTRHAALYCPCCLAGDATPYLHLSWRLSWMTVCPEHAVQLRDACPHCAAPFTPYLNHLGVGKDLSLDRRLPFGWCPNCEGDLRGDDLAAHPGTLAFQNRLTAALECEWMAWPTLETVPALEGFDVLHQLLSVLAQEAPQRYVAQSWGMPGPQTLPERPNRSFEDFSLEDRRALLVQLAHLIGEWPRRLLEVCEHASLTRKPLVVNMLEIPGWYDVVAEQVSRANGHRPYKRTPLVAHLSLEGIAGKRDQATVPSVYRRWNILWHASQQPELLLVARALGLPWDLVWRTVSRYNVDGPIAMQDSRQGKINVKRRVLNLEQQEELRLALLSSPMNNPQMTDWIEARTGRRPSASTLWMYRRGVERHSVEGRRA